MTEMPMLKGKDAKHRQEDVSLKGVAHKGWKEKGRCICGDSRCRTGGGKGRRLEKLKVPAWPEGWAEAGRLHRTSAAAQPCPGLCPIRHVSYEETSRDANKFPFGSGKET